MKLKKKIERYWNTRTDSFQSSVRRTFFIIKFGTLFTGAMLLSFYVPEFYKNLVISPQINEEISVAIFSKDGELISPEIEVLKKEGSKYFPKPHKDGTYKLNSNDLKISFSCDTGMVVYAITNNGSLEKEYYSNCNVKN